MTCLRQLAARRFTYPSWFGVATLVSEQKLILHRNPGPLPLLNLVCLSRSWTLPSGLWRLTRRARRRPWRPVCTSWTVTSRTLTPSCQQVPSPAETSGQEECQVQACELTLCSMMLGVESQRLQSWHLLCLSG